MAAILLGENFVKNFHHQIITKFRKQNRLLFFFILLLSFSHFCPIANSDLLQAQNNNEEKQVVVTSPGQLYKEKDIDDHRWPNKQLNVFIDERTLNLTEFQIIEALLDQLEHKTCITVKRLSMKNLNPFNSRRFSPDEPESEQNFVYIFKTRLPMHRSKTAVGLSTFGCARQGRQSIILSDYAFIVPDLVLVYHLLRTLGVGNLKRPDSEVNKRIAETLPESQKINHQLAIPDGPYFAYATIASAMAARTSAGALDSSPLLAASNQEILSSTRNSLSAESTNNIRPVEYLSDEDLKKIKELYKCTDYVNKLSLKPINELTGKNETFPHFYSSEYSSKQQQVKEEEEEKFTTRLPEPPLLSTDRQLEDAAKAIANSILIEETNDKTPSTCKSNSSYLKECSSRDRSAKAVDVVMRPMLLKLDSFNAHDPLMKQANQMKLSLINGNTTQIYQPQLMNTPDWPGNSKQQRKQSDVRQRGQNGAAGEGAATKTSTNEMQISFEQTSGKELAQVLKLCSCTCQTMIPAPSPAPSPSPLPSTAPRPSITTETPVITSSSKETEEQPVTSETPVFPLTEPTWIIETESRTSEPPEPTTSEPIISTTPTTSSSNTELPTMLPITTTEYPSPPTPITTTATTTSVTDEIETEEPPVTTLRPSTSSQAGNFSKTEPTTEAPTLLPVTPSTTTTAAAAGGSFCEQVEWVKPNKSVYSSAKIVWDVDRANQNYFICQNQVNGELVPGKTHGFSCKVSSEGKAYEMHNFNVLTKPEKVNLAWVQRDSKSFGKTNLPVIGGYSRKNSFDNQDPYVVSRCLVRDENNDVITLIGYVNSQGAGWFPFDDIQIECAQYDVLACVT